MTKLTANQPEDVEYLAELLHESGREAVEKGQVVRDDIPVKAFIPWAELTEKAREGRRSMARFIIADGRPWAFMVETLAVSVFVAVDSGAPQGSKSVEVPVVGK